MNWLNTFQHLLPRAKAWRLTPGTMLRQVIEGLTVLPDEVRREFDRVWLDLFPETTRELDAWEAQWALPDTGMSEANRRARLAATWKAKGGQSPKYIQDTLRAAGFDVYVHEWWVPGSDPLEVRNPLEYIRGDNALVPGVNCGEPWVQCGEEDAQCGNLFVQPGYLLVNRVQYTRAVVTSGCGEELMQCGEETAVCGGFSTFTFDDIAYNVPTDSQVWPYFFYIGGQNFGDIAEVPYARRTEFETLCLKIAPLHMWMGLLISYT